MSKPSNNSQKVRALDGSILDVEGLESATGWAFRAWFVTGRSGPAALCSTEAGAHENSPLPDATVVSEAKAGSARLLAFADPANTDQPTTTFVYQDRYHELYTTQAGVGIPMDLFVAFLRPLDITDTVEGIQAVARKGADARVDLNFGLTMVPDVAYVTSYLSEQALAGVPTHKGQQAHGGELWKLEDRPGVLLANDSVATTIEALTDPTDANFVSLAQSVRISRTAT